MCRNPNHNMKVRYGNCSNILCYERGLCSFRTKSLKCLANKSNIRYYECGEHNLDEEARADEPRAHHGCTSKRLAESYKLQSFLSDHRERSIPVVEPRDIKVLETAEDIQARREQVLTRYEQFKESAP